MSPAGVPDAAAERRRLRALRPALERRARMTAALRRTLAADGFLEVETPVRLAAPALEPHIDAEPAGEAFLRTSPELHMKRLLAAGYPRIFQLGPCFRQGERGRLHHPEYTMLEWYRAEADYRAVLRDAERLVRTAARAVAEADPAPPRPAVDPEAPWLVLRVEDAFLRWAGWNPVKRWDADRFDLDLVDCVEPRLPRDRATVLIDYPAPAAALARLSATDPRVAERWELYLGAVEIANAFSELTDAAEQRARFEACAAARARAGRPVYPLDEAFLAALAAGLPPSAGVALGVDRLALVLAGGRDLDDVLAFRE